MRKILCLFVCAVLCASVVKAQIIKPSVTLGFNAMYCMPQGDFKNAYKFGAGGEIYGGVGWGKTFVLATVGYRAFKEEANISSGTLTFIPVKLGVKRLFAMKRLFIQADAGFLTSKLEKSTDNHNGFTYDIGAGLRLGGVELGLFYDGYKPKDANSSLNSLNAKLGYSFSF